LTPFPTSALKYLHHCEDFPLVNLWFYLFYECVLKQHFSEFIVKGIRPHCSLEKTVVPGKSECFIHIK
jgi:hypothetical protein